MDIAIAQKRVDDIAKAMLDKNLKVPNAHAWARANQDFKVYLWWSSDADDLKSKFFHADRLDDAISDALAFIRAMPDREERNKNEFLERLAGVIDLGNKYGIDADYLNPLVASMKKLSENAITHRKERAT